METKLHARCVGGVFSIWYIGKWRELSCSSHYKKNGGLSAAAIKKGLKRFNLNSGKVTSPVTEEDLIWEEE